MASIADIIAAKKAGIKPQVNLTPPAAVAVVRPSQEEVELTEAIDRIDPPGKRKAAGLVIRETQSPIVPEVKPQVVEDVRSLGHIEGEAIDLTPLLATPMEADWHRAYNAIESDLCIMRDPRDPERAWLAVRSAGMTAWPILIKSLPLYEHPRTERPERLPF
jgi:hypothetical protein